MSVNDACRIVIYDSRVMLQIVASPTDNSRGIIDDCNMFIAQATGWSSVYTQVIHSTKLCGTYQGILTEGED